MSPRPMTLAFVNSTRKWGGVKSWTLDFGGALQARGHRVVAAVRRDTPFEDACRQRGFEVFGLGFGPKYNPFAVARVAAWFRRVRPRVAVMNISRDLDVGAVAARLCGVPVVHRVGLVEDFRGCFEERLHHRFLVDALLVPAETMRDGLLSAFPWLGGKPIEVIPNSKSPPPERAAAGADCGTLRLGVTSQLSTSKGHDLLLRALARFRDEGGEFELRIAGTGALEAELKQLAADLGLGEAIRFVGFLDDVAAFLSELDVFVLPSLKEGFPNTLLEALWAGLPTVAFDIPGAREMVGEAGLLVPVGDVAGLGRALGRLAASPVLRAELGARARRRAEERYDVGRNVLRLEAFFERVAGP